MPLSIAERPTDRLRAHGGQVRATGGGLRQVRRSGWHDQHPTWPWHTAARSGASHTIHGMFAGMALIINIRVTIVNHSAACSGQAAAQTFTLHAIHGQFVGVAGIINIWVIIILYYQ